MSVRTIRVDYLARVEGEGGLTIRVKDGKVRGVQLRIFEPPRFFEALLRGRSQMEAPDITARICGICPVAYMMSACNAIEDALGLAVQPGHLALRRLMYCGEWIESHALHVFMLHAPDFLGYPDALAMAKDHPELVRRGLRMKKIGNALIARIGGREVHPVNVRVGGFYRVPGRAELRAMLPELEWGRDAARESLSWLSALTFPEFERDYEFVSMRHQTEYPIVQGRIVSNKGLDIAVQSYDRYFEEEQVRYSTALHSRIVGRGAYVCGPLARFNLNHDRLSPLAREAARAAGLTVPCRNPFKGLLVRMVEILYAFEEAIRIVEDYVPPDRPYMEAVNRAGTGYGCTEAPRGLLYHRYTVDERGMILEAKIVPPTAQNQKVIEEDLLEMAPTLLAMPREQATARAEWAVRNYDPCISCSTHFLTLRVEEDSRE